MAAPAQIRHLQRQIDQTRRNDLGSSRRQGGGAQLDDETSKHGPLPFQTRRYILPFCNRTKRRQSESCPQTEFGRPGLHETRERLEIRFIDITPPPIFTRLKGLNDGVMGGMEMRPGMAVAR